MLILSIQSAFFNQRETDDLQALILSKIPDASVKCSTKEEACNTVFDKTTEILFITQDKSIEDCLNSHGNTVLIWQDHSELASKLDIYLQLRRFTSQFPLRLKEWKLKEVLTNSDASIVYKAVNKKGQLAAIKRFKFLPGSLSEEKIQNLIIHLNKQCIQDCRGLVGLLGGGVSDNSFYLVMEYLNKGTLRQTLDGCGNELPLTHAISWFQEIVLALDCVHKSGLIHRNLKIANILMRDDGSLALTDYGVSNRILLDSGYLLEQELYCSPHYVSPEQISGDACTKASDIYSLGVIFYELLTGGKPYSAQESYALMMHHVMAPVPLLPPELSQFQDLINKMMAKNPDDRFSSVIDAIEFLPIAA